MFCVSIALHYTVLISINIYDRNLLTWEQLQ